VKPPIQAISIKSLSQAHPRGSANDHFLCRLALGHYVADGSQPLHTTIQYNGWVGSNPNGYTTEHGIHSQFESTYVAVNITEKNFAGLVGFTFC
jgi:hypothetical protein